MELCLTITKKDLRIDAFYAGGPGGQAQNKRKTGCRITHVKSGAVGEARDSRDFLTNKRNAFLRMARSEKLNKWIKDQVKDEDFSSLINPVEYVIRTYNFQRGYVKDERTGSKYKLKEFLDGERV